MALRTRRGHVEKMYEIDEPQARLISKKEGRNKAQVISVRRF